MNTPICDFVKKYTEASPVRLHMPGHKGAHIIGYEQYDITEVKGADSLYEASGIIMESEQNASKLFGCDTFYSTEGSSQCIRAMLHLATLYAEIQGKKCKVLAGRNAHKAFVSAAALLNFEIVWIRSQTNSSYLSCSIGSKALEELIIKESPTAVYITSPDYLGILTDIRGIADVCKKHNVLLLTDNAHGAYFKFLPQSLHPIDMGADICCDSAHKTLPVLTGGAYLHINRSVADSLSPMAKNALALFGSTSPSYLILQSLDAANRYLCEQYPTQLAEFLPLVNNLKQALTEHGYTLLEQEPLKITISTKPYGYTGTDFGNMLCEHNIMYEFCDPDYIVLMLTPQISKDELHKLCHTLLSLPRRAPVTQKPPKSYIPAKVTTIRAAATSPMEEVNIKDAKDKILAAATIGCPPAVPIIVCGEKIDEQVIKSFEYYNIKTCTIIKQPYPSKAE